MKKLLIALALPLWAVQAYGQTVTTYGPTEPLYTDGGYLSDYSADGTMVMAGGSVTLANGSTYEHGNLSFQNNGSWSSLSNSLDLFNAAGAVTMGGTTAPGFFNLQFANGGTIALTNAAGANVASQLLFGNSGELTTIRASHANSALRFADDATFIGGNTDAQHVNGYVTKAGNDVFTFPTGSGTDLRTLSISAPTTAATISAAWFTGSAGTVTDPSDGSTHSLTALGAGLQAISTIGFWDYVLTAGTDAGISVTVAIPDVTPFSTAANLRLAGWNGTQWINLSAGPNASGTVENSTLTGTIPSGQTISAVAIASTIAIPLSVKYSSFTAMTDGCKGLLVWEANTDAGFHYFSIERSQDGKTFTEAGRTGEPAASGSRYTYTDQGAQEGINYYRIKDVDFAGNHSYTATKAITIHCMEKGEIRLYPTPTRGTVYIDLPGGYENAEVALYSLSGQLVHADISGKGLSRTIQLRSLASGEFLVRVANNGTVETFKILYQP